MPISFEFRKNHYWFTPEYSLSNTQNQKEIIWVYEPVLREVQQDLTGFQKHGRSGLDRHTRFLKTRMSLK